jgi:hypothetical protein
MNFLDNWRSIRSLTVVTLLFSGAIAHAAKWTYVVTDVDKSARYFDAETVQRSGNVVTVWEKRGASPGNKICCTAVSRVRFDCINRTMTLLGGRIYYLDGTVAANAERLSSPIKSEVFPDSPEEKMLKAVCGRS